MGNNLITFVFMKCSKKKFENSQDAQKRANEINEENKKNKSQKERLRPYKCDICNKFHLTSMTKDQHKWHTDAEYRHRKKHDAFIRRETEYWENRFGIKHDN